MKSLEQGMEFYKKNNYKSALHFFKEAEKSQDITVVDKERLNFYEGQTYYALKKYPQAIGCFHKVINSADKDLAIKANFYKGQSLYSFSKYESAISCFNKVPDDSELAMHSNLYKGFCYELKNAPEYFTAEMLFKKTLELSERLNYPNKDNNIAKMAEEALKSNLIHQNKFDELKSFWQKSPSKEIEETDKNNLLIDATTLDNHTMVKHLLEANTNPFKEDEYNNSAFLTAVDRRNEKLIKLFIEKYISLNTTQVDNSSNTENLYSCLSILNDSREALSSILHISENEVDHCITAVKECLGEI